MTINSSQFIGVFPI